MYGWQSASIYLLGHNRGSYGASTTREGVQPNDGRGRMGEEGGSAQHGVGAFPQTFYVSHMSTYIPIVCVGKERRIKLVHGNT